MVSILALRFAPNPAGDGAEADPGGVIEIVLAGGGAIRLTVECIDGGLSDLTQPWAAIARPEHGEA